MSIHELTWIGLVLILIGTVLTIYGQQKINDKSSKLLHDKSNKIEELSQENIKLNEKITATLTGGDSYCYLLVSRPSKRSNICDLHLISEGEYPIYDVSIRIDDVEQLLEDFHEAREAGVLPYPSITESSAHLMKAAKIFQVGNLGPKHSATLSGLKVRDRNKQSYNIYITARNFSSMQFVKFRRVGNNWKMAEKRLLNGELIKEFVEPDYPREPNGEVLW